jgi:plasmid stabilization system protein ParE
VIVTPAAEADIRAADEWWRSNRDKNPLLFAQELEVATEVLARSPNVGRAVSGRRISGNVRWIGLPGSEKKLYYRVLEEQGLVQVLRLGGARQRRRPSLG